MDDGYSFLWVMFGVFALLAFLGGMAFWYWKSRRDNVTEEDIKKCDEILLDKMLKMHAELAEMMKKGRKK